LRRIAEIIPQVRLIYLLRDPVDRAYSQYIQNHWERRASSDGTFRMSFEEYLEADPDVYNASNYLPQIRMMHELFGPDSLLLLQFVDLIKKPKATLRKVLNFLEVEDLADTITDRMVHANKSERNIGYMVRGGVLQPFRRIGVVRRIYEAMPRGLRELLVSTFLNSPYGRRAGKRYTPRPMQPGTRRALIERLSPSFGEIGQLLGADLSSWLDPRDSGAAVEMAATATR
jgi:hypothetical protein